MFTACSNEVLDVSMGVLLSAVPRIRMVWCESLWIWQHVNLKIALASETRPISADHFSPCC